jgi:hypothetical protein
VVVSEPWRVLAGIAGAGLAEILHALEGVGGDRLDRGDLADRRGLEDLLHHAAGRVGGDEIAAVRIGADRQGLDLVRGEHALVVAEEAVERRLVLVIALGIEHDRLLLALGRSGAEEDVELLHLELVPGGCRRRP